MTKKPQEKNGRWRVFRIVGLGLILFGCFIRVLDPYPVRMSRLVYFDILQRLSPRAFNPDLPVRVVDIDEAALETWGQWPWPRTLLAQMVEHLGEYGAAAIAFDMLFAEPDRYSPARLLNDPALSGVLSVDRTAADLDNDVLFGAEMANWPVVLGVAARLSGEDQPVFAKAGIIEIGDQPTEGLVSVPQWTPLAPPLDQDATGIGGVNVSPMGDTGVVRRVPVLWGGPDGALPALGIEALRVAMDESVILAEGAQDETGIMLGVEIGAFILPTTENGEVWVRYRHENPALYLPANRIMQSGDDPEMRAQIEGRIILVGTSAAGLFDMHLTALGESVPGVSIHAQLLEQILTDEMISRSDVNAALELLAFALLGLVVIVVMTRRGAVASFVAGGISAAVVLGISWLAFRNHLVLFDVTFPLLGGMANFGVLAGYLFVSTEREKRVIRRIFSRYVSPEILHELEGSGHALQLGGETQDITVMFSDIRGFTPLSESVSATDLVAILNELFSQVGDQILAQQGTIDKFIGDAVMAFWNAPLPVADHPTRAAQAALLMRQALVAFNASEVMRGRPPIALATGCATGRACVGNIGSRRRFNYTVIGDVVNVAARLEQSCRHVNYDIVISRAVVDDTRTELAVLEAGFVELKGKAELEPVYILVGNKSVLQSAAFQSLAETHKSLIASIRDGASHDLVRARCQDCASRAADIEPGLSAFYDALPGRAADFRSDVQSNQVLFSHRAAGH